jgi:hypothetical protein
MTNLKGVGTHENRKCLIDTPLCVSWTLTSLTHHVQPSPSHARLLRATPSNSVQLRVAIARTLCSHSLRARIRDWLGSRLTRWFACTDPGLARIPARTVVCTDAGLARIPARRVPNPVAERIFAIFTFLCGAIVYSSLYGNMNNFLNKMDAAGSRCISW